MTTLKELAQTAAEDLKAFAERLQVQAHLGGKEAQDALASLQPYVDKVTAWLATASGEAEVQARLAAMDAKNVWAELQPRLREIAQRVQDKAAPIADEAKLKAHLAAMDAKQAVEESTPEEAKQALEELKAQLRELRDSLGKD